MVQLRPADLAHASPANLKEVELGFEDVRLLAERAKLTLPPWAAHARAVALVPHQDGCDTVRDAAAWAAVTSTSEIVGVYCVPARRRHGLAAAALRAALASAGARGSAYCLLPHGNSPAQALLRTMGFEPVASGATAAFAAAAMVKAQ
jgi:predicted GNAT family acetyltransferase